MGEVLTAALSHAFELATPLAVTGRSEVLGKFISARDNDTFLALRAEVAVGEGKPWGLLLVWRQAEAAALLDERQGSTPAPHGAGDRRRPDAKPFADVPLPLNAVLARINVPVSRISAMQPGDTIPLALGRNVALRLADREIARGEVGACDGALALRLTSIAWNSPVKGQEQ
jgi:flagellar motor switch protein FliM